MLATHPATTARPFKIMLLFTGPVITTRPGLERIGMDLPPRMDLGLPSPTHPGPVGLTDLDLDGPGAHRPLVGVGVVIPGGDRWAITRYPHYWGGAAVGYRGAAVWGPGGWAATTGNVYRSWGSTTAVTRRSGGYNAYTGTAWRSQSGMSYNSRTGTIAAGQRGAASNVFTGNYAYGGRGTAYNPNTGNSISAGHIGGGNAYNGSHGSAGYVKGDQGGVARVGDNVYAGKDGNVYKRENGSWNQLNGNGSWSGVKDQNTSQKSESATLSTASEWKYAYE